MTEKERVDEAVRHLKAVCHVEDRRSFWRRLLESLRAKITPSTDIRRPIKKVELTGGAEF